MGKLELTTKKNKKEDIIKQKHIQNVQMDSKTIKKPKKGEDQEDNVIMKAI